MARAGAPTGRQVLIVLLASGAIGAFFGVTSPSWQDVVVEPAQVLAGVVRYPVQTPLYAMFMKMWSVLNQMGALAIYLGCSERALALVLSAAVGMLSFQALAVFVLAVSGGPTFAVLSSFFLFFTNATAGGVSYPVILLGAPFTHGIFGLAYMLLAVALIGAGCVRSGAVLLGFGPAVHLTLGILTLCAVALAIATEAPSRRWLDQAGYFLAGLTAAAASATFHVLSAGVDLYQAAAGLFASASSTHVWGQDHRRPFTIFAGSMLIVWANLGLLALWSRPFSDDLPVHARFLLKALIASAAVGLLLSISYWVPPAFVPNTLFALMPSRLLNLNVMTCMALLISLAWRYRDNVWIQGLLTTIIVACSIGSMVNGEQALGARLGMALGGPMLIVFVGLRRLGIGVFAARPSVIGSLRRVTLLVPAGILALMVIATIRQFDPLPGDGNEPLYRAAAGRSGLLLVAPDLQTVQLHTRRPLLLDVNILDNLSYVPEATAQTNDILLRVYGIDTAHDVPDWNSGGLWPDAGRDVWQARTTAGWQNIGREFGFTDIITPPGWNLHLPVVALSSDYILYGIP